MANDFFVRFGSDAAKFGRELDRDLAGARRAIGTFSKQLADLESTTANRRAATLKHLAAMSKEADAVQKKLDQLAASHESAGVSPESAEVKRIAQDVYRDIANVTSGLEGMMSTLGQTVARIGQAGEAFQAAETTARRSIAQSSGETTAANVKSKFPAGTIVGEVDRVTSQVIRAFDKAGKELAAGTKVGGRYAPTHEQLGLPANAPIPGAISAADFKRLTQPAPAPTPAAPPAAPVDLHQLAAALARFNASPSIETSQPVQLNGIAKATIDEAAFQRVVGAVERNVAATQAVEKAVDRLGGRLGTGAPGERQPTEVATTTPAGEGSPDLPKLTKEMKSELHTAFQGELEATRKDHGPEAYDRMWKSLLTQQQEAMAKGSSIYTKEQVVAANEAAANKPTKRQTGLDETIDKLATRERELRTEIEQLAQAEQETGHQSQVFTRQLAELADVEKRLANARQARLTDESRAEQAERQRRAAAREAAAQAGLTISPEERQRRAEERGRLELAANPEALAASTGRGKGALGKAELVQIADTLNRQGYETNLGARRSDTGLPRASVKEIVAEIARAGQDYLRAGRITAEDLSSRRVQAPPSAIPTDVQNMLDGGDLAAMSQRFEQELGRLGLSVKEAYQLIGASIRSGGDDPRREKKGRVMPGAEVGDELRDRLLAAPDAIRAYEAERKAAARSDVVRTLRTNPDFNPYEMDRKVVGHDEGAQRARRDMAALLEATQEVDQFALELGRLDEGLVRAQRKQEAILRALEAFDKIRTPTQEQVTKYVADLEASKQQPSVIADKRHEIDRYMATWKDPQGEDAQFMRTPGYQESAQRREQMRQQQQEEADAQREKDQQNYLRKAALRESAFEFLGGARIFATNEGNTKDYITRTLPGVRSAGSYGRQRLAFTDDEMMGTAENRKAIRQMTAGAQGYVSRLNRLVDLLGEEEVTEKELDEARTKVVGALNKMLNAYSRAFPSNPVPEMQQFLPQDTEQHKFGFDSNWLDRAFNSIDPETGKVGDRLALQEIQRQNKSAAGQEKIAAQEAAAQEAFANPGRKAEFDKKRAQALQTMVTGLNADIRGVSAELKDYGAAIRAAEKELRSTLGTKANSKIRDLEAALDKLETQEAKWILQERHQRPKDYPTGAADLEANQAEQARYRASIQREYDKTPATMEAKATLDAARAAEADAKQRNQEMRERRAALQFQRRQTLGIVGKGDLEKIQEAYDKALETTAAAERRHGQITARLAKAKEEMAQAEERQVAEMGKTTVVSGAHAPAVAQSEYYQILKEQETDLKSQLKAAQTAMHEAEMSGDSHGADRADSETLRLRHALAATQAELQKHEVPLEERPSFTRPDVLNGRPIDQAETQRLNDLRKEIDSYEGKVRDASNALSEQRADLKALHEALQKATATYNEDAAVRNAKNAARGRAPEGAVGAGGSGGGGTGGSTAQAGAEGPDGPSNGILREILAALNRIDGRLKGTLKVSGKITQTVKNKTVETETDASTTAPAPRKSSEKVADPRSTEQGRRDFESSIGQSLPAVGQFLQSGKDVQAAAAMIAEGTMSETRVLQLFRDKLQQTATQAKAFAAEVKAAGGDIRLQAAADAAAQRRAKQEAQQFKTRGGDTMSYGDARKEMNDALALASKKEKAAAASAESDRKAAAAAMVLSTQMAKLTPQTKAEIAELERMARSGDKSADAQERLAAQMAKVYGMTAHNLNARATETNQTVGQIYKGAGINAGGEEVAQMRNTARTLGYQVDRDLSAGIAQGGGMVEQVAAQMFGPRGFWGRIIGSTGAFVVRNFTAGVVFGLTNAMQELVSQAIQAEAVFVRVSDAMEETGQSTQGLRSDLRGLAIQYGVSLQDVYETTAGLTGLFDNAKDLTSGVEVVTQLQRISMGALNVNEAMGILSATVGGFGQEIGTGLDGMTHVADVLTTIQNNMSVNVETSSEGVGAMAGLAQSMKIDFEDTATYVAQIAKLTNQTGAGAGEGLSRVLAAMQTGRGRAAIIKAMPQSGVEEQLNQSNYGAVLKTMMQNWDNLTEAQQRNIVVTLGGQRQARVVAALFADTNKVLDTAAKAHDANGAAQKRNDEIMKTMNAQVGVLRANFAALADNLLDSGIANSIGILLMGFNALFGLINKLLGAVNSFADDHSFVKALLEWGAGLAGFMIMINLLGKSIVGLKTTMASMRGMVIGDAVAGGVGGAGAAGAGAAAGAGRTTLTSAAASIGTASSNLSARAANRAIQAESAVASKAFSGVSKTMAGASWSANKLSAGLNTVATSGAAAQVGMALAAAGIIMLVQDVMSAHSRAEDFRKQLAKDNYVRSGGTGQSNDDGTPYIGPYDAGYRENLKATSGYGNTIKTLLTSPFRDGNFTNAKSWFGSPGYLLDRSQGILPEDQQSKLDAVHFQALTALHKQIEMPIQTSKDIDKTNTQVAEMLTNARDEILKDGSLSDQQKQAALAQLEQYAVGFDGIVTKLRVKAQGLISADMLTTDQINQISEATQLMQQNAATGNAQVAKIASQLVNDQGLDKNSDMYKRLKVMAQGGINSAQFLKGQAEAVSEELKNANAKYRTMLDNPGNYSDEDKSSQRQLVLQKAAELVQVTEQQLQAIISDANTVAQLQATRGNYQGSANTIEQALRDFHAERHRGQESPVQRAANDLIESQGQEQAAQNRAEGLNAQLETQKARGVGSQQSAALDQQIAYNTYQTLREQRQIAQTAGMEGPSIKAIRDAKNQWLAAQHQSLLEAQGADIAQLTLQAAQQWNAIAAGGINEQIALQQYTDAVQNFGENSKEAIAAATNLTNVRKQNVETQDQVAEATRQASLAAIPTGNAIAIAQKTLQNARAALGAAEKYGHNSTQYQSALQSLYSAQNGMVQAQADRAAARIDLQIALDEAAGRTVQAAEDQVKKARQALQTALKQSGGANSTGVAQARAQLIQSQAAARDARLQDQLDTIDFNLQMGKMTQSSAISALQHILKTSDLTKQQRRQLLLQIKGYKDAISQDGQWNFGDIKMPTPYQMRRYIDDHRKNVRRLGEAQAAQYSGLLNEARGGGSGGRPVTHNNHQTTHHTTENRTTIQINGADVAKVRRVVEDVLGRGHRTRTTQPRRR